MPASPGRRTERRLSAGAAALAHPLRHPHTGDVQRGRPGFDGGRNIAGCMPRGLLSSLIQWQIHSCQRRQLRPGRL